MSSGAGSDQAVTWKWAAWGVALIVIVALLVSVDWLRLFGLFQEPRYPYIRNDTSVELVVYIPVPNGEVERSRIPPGTNRPAFDSPCLDSELIIRTTDGGFVAESPERLCEPDEWVITEADLPSP